MSLSTSGLLYCDTASPVFRFGVTQWSGSRLGRHQPAMAMSSVLWSRMLRTYAPHSPMIFTLVLIPFSVSWPATACAMSLSIAQRPLGDGQGQRAGGGGPADRERDQDQREDHRRVGRVRAQHPRPQDRG